ncbi:FAD-binding domain-containing protein [Patellaria atrata CBS 101060]|uniref:FAD-binding domain-containing protein n=1 Tax=Patellaria atrata CBS 101060 TaxID=1346257 RepID=A0A9P4S3E0_9PEZI|nr:FAD-binding domain-containing protein [Patellaria atrata CBS 101060]
MWSYISQLFNKFFRSDERSKKPKVDKPATIEGITGNQFPKGTQAYQNNKYQYASSTYELDHNMNPGLIIQPRNKADIKLTVKYAKSKNIAVAVRTGGHQYSGASSTSAPNILLDLKKTFQGPEDRTVFEKDGKSFVRTSVSWSLGDFNAYLTKHHLFVPHGQCTSVHLGGHVQTGGYGQLGRSFGLFGDHVLSIELIDHNGMEKEVTKQTDPDLFYAILGGSPGNLGVITHFTIEVHRDNDHQGSRGLKALYWYDPKTLKRLIDILVEMSDDENFPRNYDFCISVLSSSFKLLDLWPELDGRMREEHPEIYGENSIPFWPRTIVVYAQWVPFEKNDVCNMDWFNRIRKGSIFNQGVEEKPMSKLTGDWIFRNVREFEHPYVKRTYLTNSTTLGRDGWADWVTKRIDAIVKPEANRCWLSAQLQCYGGKYSKFTTNAGNGTAFSWRDSTLIATLDCFHENSAKSRAEDWQKVNDAEGIGPNGIFSKQDRRVLWGSYGSYDLDASWAYYYENREKYEKLRQARQLADPNGVFTYNSFCVKRSG